MIHPQQRLINEQFPHNHTPDFTPAQGRGLAADVSRCGKRWLEVRARNESRILRVLLVSVPTCNRSLINHNRRVWQIKRIRSRRIIFHGDHQI